MGGLPLPLWIGEDSGSYKIARMVLSLTELLWFLCLLEHTFLILLRSLFRDERNRFFRATSDLKLWLLIYHSGIFF